MEKSGRILTVKMSVSQDGRQQVLHVRGDSDAELETLFKSVLSPKPEAVQTKPMRMRKLPDSFFKEPQRPPGHSRESSADSTNYGQTGSGGQTSLAPSGLSIAHSRAHSSPAALQDMHAVSAQQLQHHHLRQQSYDVGSTQNEVEAPLPPGWEMATTATGQRYFLE